MKKTHSTTTTADGATNGAEKKAVKTLDLNLNGGELKFTNCSLIDEKSVAKKKKKEKKKSDIKINTKKSSESVVLVDSDSDLDSSEAFVSCKNPKKRKIYVTDSD